MIMKIIVVINVVKKNFLPILGFFGDPGSVPAIVSSNFLFLWLIPIGNDAKNIIHQIQIYITIEPVRDIKFVLCLY